MSSLPFVSDTFDPQRWREIALPGDPLTDMTMKFWKKGFVKDFFSSSFHI